jgi:cobalt/nickel transport system permease protein
MPRLESALAAIGGLERLAARETPMQRLDARVKVLVTILFILTVVSFHRHDLAGLVPLALFPVATAALGAVPARELGLKLLIASPFAILMGIFNPLIEREALWSVGPIVVSAGWVSYASILARFALSLTAALVLVSTTGFDGVCAALGRLRAPRAFTTQLLMLHRYLFVLVAEAVRMTRAWRLRAPDGRRPAPRVFATLLGQLLLRALDRAQRVHMAMLSRGFSGAIHAPRPMRMRRADWAFLFGWCVYFALVRSIDVTRLLGQAAIQLGIGG